MQLGAFSISLAVADLAASQSFYEKLGFSRTGGDGKGYVIMVNGPTIVGLFKGMFDKNILTFNPGLAQDGSRLQSFTDVREVRERLVADGIALSSDTDPAGTGPASIAFMDPDGNPILVDQFFPRPGGGKQGGGRQGSGRLGNDGPRSNGPGNGGPGSGGPEDGQHE